MTRQEVLGIETNYRLETTVQDVLAMYMHIYLQGLYYVQSFVKKMRKCYLVVLGMSGWMSCSMLQDAYAGVEKQVIY